MKRVRCVPRHDWREKAERLGFLFHTIDGEPYWDESAYYAFTLREIEDDLETPTAELHALCLDLVDEVVQSEELLQRLAIPPEQWTFVRDSWFKRDPHLYGRMDFSYDGTGPARLLELNYDTPTALYESAFFQWVWLEDLRSRRELPDEADQFNRIQEDLLEAFQHLRRHWRCTGTKDEARFVFSSVRESEEDRGTVRYLQDIAEQAGFRTRHTSIEDIGIDALGRFTDQSDEVVQMMFKLYPWEFLFADGFGQFLSTSPTSWVEPPWKAILSNKGILPLLWERHAGHPNLLPALFDPDPSSELRPGWVRKPFFSREGANVSMRLPDGQILSSEGPYDDGPCILQEFHALPDFDGNRTLVGSWVVGDRASGIGIREDSTLITRDTSRFLPHAIL